MNDYSINEPPVMFRVVAVAAVIWNVLGVLAFVMNVAISAEAMAAMPEVQQALYAAQPAWVTGAFAIAVFAGLGGSIALALRKGIATAIFVVSLVAVIAQMFYAFAMSNMLSVMGASSAVMPSLIIIIAAALVWFSIRSKAKGWTG